MTINLDNIPTHVLTLKDSAKRYETFKQNVGTHLHVEPFYGERYPTIDEGCYKSSYKLYHKVWPPVLILEDDVHVTSHFSKLLNNVPDDTDALYLGTSNWGIKNNHSSFNNFDLEKYNDEYYKISYMTTTHAILFLSNRFWQTMLNILTCNINKMPIEPVDNHIAKIHPHFNVYAVNKPMFYQNTPGNDTLTSHPIENVYKERNMNV